MHDGHWNAGVFTINEDRWLPPQGSKKAQKRREDEQTEEHEKKIENTFKQLWKIESKVKLLIWSLRLLLYSWLFFHCHIWLGSLHTSPTIPCIHTPHPHSFPLSHSSSSPLEVDENGPQLLLESEPCLKSAAEEGRGGNEVDRCNEQKREENVGQNISLLSWDLYVLLFIHTFIC